MGTNQPWNWTLTVLKTIKMTLVRPPMTNFKMTVRADCAVMHVACPSPPPVYQSSCQLTAICWGQWKLAFGQKLLAPQVADLWKKANFSPNLLLYWASLVAQLVKNPPAMGDLDSTPGLGRSPGEGKGNPLQYPGLENSMECIIHGVAKSQTWLPLYWLFIGLWVASSWTHFVLKWCLYFRTSTLLVFLCVCVTVPGLSCSMQHLHCHMWDLWWGTWDL